MAYISYQQKNFKTAIKKLSRRSQPLAEVEKTVTQVIVEVKKGGDKALLALGKKFDRVNFRKGSDLKVSEAELAASGSSLSTKEKRAIAASRKNATFFAKRSLRKNWTAKNAQGAQVGEVFQPFERVGIYVPGGTAPLVSTVNMTVALAKAAGVPEIVVCTPPRPDGSINPALLYALQQAGATEVYKVGGAQALAAMAVGTRTIAPVAKVFGPGNSYVVEAKRQLFGLVSVDLLPGPSEILVLCDSSAKPAWIATDLLAQAEHGGDSLMVLVSDSEKTLQAVQQQVIEQAATLTRQKQLQAVLKKGSTYVLVENMQDGVQLCNDFAPEHVLLISRKEKSLIPKIKTAGAIFLGNYSPVAVGDFLAGPSHELPTGGAGKSFPGLTVDQFQRRTSIVKLDRAAMEKSAPIVEVFAQMEGLDAHGRSASIRLEK
ncbi:MAG: histidinol dehydrogenase [Verrucomicrobiales bacterium]|nr:histidinol dehydrogenase [Verrucomicrobiales bacterium]